ncbi:kinesin motor family protein [Dorcoceras hygrometricum]|uniref:Kinesin motor family protein n=1 Tax=Dorcoceras hygrometricum TaxID=472368 RepID=A0A2Z7C4P4_9LAMI|nr:kinesin motor family protein [Dorcoceras hygrometricum]
MEEARKQVEVETAEDELSLLQQEVQDSNTKEMETRDRMMLLQTEMKVLKDNLDLKVKDNTTLTEMLEDRENRLRKLTKEWELLTCEIEYILAGGQDALKDATARRNQELLQSKLQLSNCPTYEKEISSCLSLQENGI